MWFWPEHGEANPTIKPEKLVKRAWGWKHFIELSQALI
jgi:hypothetical protein